MPCLPCRAARNECLRQHTCTAPAPADDSGDSWTRYRFDSHAELEEDRRGPPEARDDGEPGGSDAAMRAQGALNSVSFQQGNAQAVQQERDEQHAAAIFGGGPAGGPAAAAAAKPGGRGAPARRGSQAPAAPAADPLDAIAQAEADGAVVVWEHELPAAPQPAAPAGGGGGGGANWRERALAAKRAKQQEQG